MLNGIQLGRELNQLMQSCHQRNSSGQYVVIPANIQAFINRGAFIEERGSKKDFTPLMLAVYFRRFDLAEILLNAGANLHAVDNDGNNVLMIYLEKITRESLLPRFLKMLVDRYAQSDLPNNAGNNAIMLAVNALPSNHPVTIKVVNLLLTHLDDHQKRAALQQRNDFGQNCIDIAFEKEQKTPSSSNAFSVRKQLGELFASLPSGMPVPSAPSIYPSLNEREEIEIAKAMRDSLAISSPSSSSQPLFRDEEPKDDEIELVIQLGRQSYREEAVRQEYPVFIPQYTFDLEASEQKETEILKHEQAIQEENERLQHVAALNKEIRLKRINGKKKNILFEKLQESAKAPIKTTTNFIAQSVLNQGVSFAADCVVPGGGLVAKQAIKSAMKVAVDDSKLMSKIGLSEQGNSSGCHSARKFIASIAGGLGGVVIGTMVVAALPSTSVSVIGAGIVGRSLGYMLGRRGGHFVADGFNSLTYYTLRSAKDLSQEEKSAIFPVVPKHVVDKDYSVLNKIRREFVGFEKALPKVEGHDVSIMQYCYDFLDKFSSLEENELLDNKDKIRNDLKKILINLQNIESSALYGALMERLGFSEFNNVENAKRKEDLINQYIDILFTTPEKRVRDLKVRLNKLEKEANLSHDSSVLLVQNPL